MSETDNDFSRKQIFMQMNALNLMFFMNDLHKFIQPVFHE